MRSKKRERKNRKEVKIRDDIQHTLKMRAKKEHTYAERKQSRERARDKNRRSEMWKVANQRITHTHTHTGASLFHIHEHTFCTHESMLNSSYNLNDCFFFRLLFSDTDDDDDEQPQRSTPKST